MSGRTPIALPGIGPRMAEWLCEAGIESESKLRSIGAAAAYARIKQQNPQAVTLNALWALHGAIAGIPWTSIPPEDKARLKREVRDG